MENERWREAICDISVATSQISSDFNRNGGKIVAKGRSAFLLARTDSKKHIQDQNEPEIPIDGTKPRKKQKNAGDGAKAEF
jgi:hypothetical protein